MKEILIISLLFSVGTGCGLGVLLFVLDDKWKALPSRLCRFCVTFWASFIICGSFVGLMFYTEPIFISVTIPLSIAVATVLAGFSYVYIKNANL